MLWLVDKKTGAESPARDPSSSPAQGAEIGRRRGCRMVRKRAVRLNGAEGPEGAVFLAHFQPSFTADEVDAIVPRQT
jgi:hypothetical protein